MGKKLSVIVPVYNAEGFIERCVGSLTNQTYKNLEILLVNDGSKDSSLQKCRELAAQDERIRVFDKENGGASSARNFGLKQATGDYIGFCDADDFHDSDTFETLIRIMEENDLATVECLSKVYNSENALIERDDDSRELYQKSAEEAIRDIFLRKGNVHLATRVTKAEYILGLEIPEGKRVEDFYFTICLLIRTKGTAIYNYPFYSYYSSEGSVTRSGGGSIYLDAIYFYDKAVEYLKEYNYDLADAEVYYLLKMYYLLSISMTSKERKKYSKLVREYKKDLKQKRALIKADKYLSKKEKTVLGIATCSFGIARLMYLVKNIGRN